MFIPRRTPRIGDLFINNDNDRVYCVYACKHDSSEVDLVNIQNGAKIYFSKFYFHDEYTRIEELEIKVI